MNCITQNLVSEWSFCSNRKYKDPFSEIELDMVFTSPDGQDQIVPAFWAGGNVWRVRFATPVLGLFRYRTICSDPLNADLHNLKGELFVTPYTGDNPLYRHGPIRVAQDKRHFEHADGATFFWLADTWWMSLCHRLGWPRDFQNLAMDRAQKGFTVIQLVAGLYPDMPWQDERGRNEAGFPWDKDFTTINPEYFNYADRRIAYLAESGLVPCLVGAWGYFLGWMGEEKMKRHWRNLVARYGAYPMFWCLAGEGTMPYYLSATKEKDKEIQKKGWTQLARYVRSIDPFRRPIGIHPSREGRDCVEDPALLDFEMLQTGHGDRASVGPTVETVLRAVAREPRMPVINSEVCYEGIAESCRQEVQRFMFWFCATHGTAGHTYGANGIWQVNGPDKPYGPSPSGMSWGDTPWTQAAKLPGAGQVALGKKFLARYEWWKFESHPEWVDPRWSAENFFAPYAAGIPRKVRMILLPFNAVNIRTIKEIEKDVNYRAFMFDPTNGNTLDLGRVIPDENGDWDPTAGQGLARLMPVMHDWILIVEAAESS